MVCISKKRAAWRASHILFLNSCPASLQPTLKVRHAMVKRHGKLFSKVSSDWFNQNHTEHKPLSEERIRVEADISFHLTAFRVIQCEPEPAFARVLLLTSKQTQQLHLLEVQLRVTAREFDANREQRLFWVARDGSLLSRVDVTNDHRFQSLRFAGN